MVAKVANNMKAIMWIGTEGRMVRRTARSHSKKAMKTKLIKAGHETTHPNSGNLNLADVRKEENKYFWSNNRKVVNTFYCTMFAEADVFMHTRVFFSFSYFLWRLRPDLSSLIANGVRGLPKLFLPNFEKYLCKSSGIRCKTWDRGSD